MNPRIEILNGLLASAETEVVAEMEILGAELAPAGLSGGLEVQTGGTTIPVPRPIGGGGLPDWLRGFWALQFIVNRMPLELAYSGTSLATMPGAVADRLTTLINAWCEPVSDALESGDTRLLFGPEGPSLTDLVGVARCLSTLELGFTGGGQQFPVLVRELRLTVRTAILSRLEDTAA